MSDREGNQETEKDNYFRESSTDEEDLSGFDDDDVSEKVSRRSRGRSHAECVNSSNCYSARSSNHQNLRNGYHSLPSNFLFGHLTSQAVGSGGANSVSSHHIRRGSLSSASHISTHKSKYPCGQCGRSLTDFASLQRHLRYLIISVTLDRRLFVYSMLLCTYTLSMYSHSGPNIPAHVFMLAVNVEKLLQPPPV